MVTAIAADTHWRRTWPTHSHSAGEVNLHPLVPSPTITTSNQWEEPSVVSAMNTYGSQKADNLLAKVGKRKGKSVHESFFISVLHYPVPLNLIQGWDETRNVRIFIMSKILNIRDAPKVCLFHRLSMALTSTQPLTEISTRNISGGKGRSVGRPARKTDNLTAICEPTV
jgi:hypothetical protein